MKEAVVESAIIIEYSIVFFTVLFIYSMYGFKIYQKKNKRVKIKKLKKYIEAQLAYKKSSYANNDFVGFRKKMLNLDVFLEVVTEFNLLYKDDLLWLEFKRAFFYFVVLPFTRKKAFSLFAKNKLLAAQLFSLSPLKEDERILLRLLLNENFLIQMNAAKALIAIFSEKGIKLLITRLAKERRLNQTVFLTFFQNAPQTVARMVLRELERYKNPYKRAICYKILYRCKATTNTIPNEQDIFSQNFFLRLAAIRFLSLCKTEKTLSILLSLLKDPEWQIRVKALHSLENFKEDDIAEEVGKCLNDRNWWVRYTSATLLKKIGKKGLLILENQSETKDLFAFEAAQFVLEEQ